MAAEDYINSFDDMDPRVRQRLLDMVGQSKDPGVSMPPENSNDAGTAPPPPGMSYEGNGPRTDVVRPDSIMTKGAPSEGLNWKRAGERVQKAGETVNHVLDYAVPFGAAASAAGRATGRAAGDAITGKQGPATEDTGEGLSQEMIDNRNRVAKERAGAGEEAQDEGSGGSARPTYTPGHLVGAKWVPGTRSETIQHGIDAAALEPGERMRDAAQGYGQAAAADLKQAATVEAQADVAYAEAHRQATEEAVARAQRLENEKQAYMIREHEKLDALNVAAQAQVDPEAAKGSAGVQLFSAIAVALGQFGASLNGGPNTALQIVNANIDRRIHAQEANIGNAHKALSNEQSLYKDNLAAFGDRERAALATKMQMLDQAKAIADQQYAAAKSNRNDAQYNMLLKGLNDEYAQTKDQFGIRTADQRATTANEHYMPAHMEGGTPGGKPLSNLVTVGKTTFQMPNEKQSDRAVEKIQIINSLQRLNNRALNVRAELSKLNSVTDRVEYNKRMAELQDMENDKINMLSTQAGQGVVKESEFARAMNTQAFYTKGYGLKNSVNPLAQGDRDVADHNLRRQNKRGEEEARNFVTSAGGKVVQQGYQHDASGNLAPVARYTGQDASAVEQLPPDGARSMRSGQETPTAGPPLSETIDEAPDFGSAPAAGSGGGKGGKGPTVKKRK